MFGQRLIEPNFHYEDHAYYFPNLVENPSEYLTWMDVEDCVNNTSFYEFDIIGNDGFSVSIDRYDKSWCNTKLVQNSQQIANHINDGDTFVITNYGFRNRKTQELLREFEEIFPSVACTIHAYGGVKESKSFNIHDDFPPNFIIQVEGETKWKVYKNRASSLLDVGFGKNTISEEDLEIDLEVVLKPGDTIYIPSRAYHCAFPDSGRLSMSIPCWPKQFLMGKKSDPNYYSIQSNGL